MATKNESNGNGNSKRKVVYTIIETGEGKSIWRQVGSAFVNCPIPPPPPS
ncbi:MAG: hypothetical protein KKA99_06805 [Gammaproteobacteria bacterium]|nr:hypothetical protein [Gammaproteobacteria bacterium]